MASECVNRSSVTKAFSALGFGTEEQAHLVSLVIDYDVIRVTMLSLGQNGKPYRDIQGHPTTHSFDIPIVANSANVSVAKP